MNGGKSYGIGKRKPAGKVSPAKTDFSGMIEPQKKALGTVHVTGISCGCLNIQLSIGNDCTDLIKNCPVLRIADLVHLLNNNL